MSTVLFDDDLSSIALQFRGPVWTHAAAVRGKERDQVVSRFVVWLLDQTFSTLSTNEQRELWRVVRGLYQSRIDGGVFDSEAWEESGADGFGAIRLWPAEWLGGGGIPTTSPMGRAVMTACLAWYRSLPTDAERQAVIQAVATQLITECQRYQQTT